MTTCPYCGRCPTCGRPYPHPPVAIPNAWPPITPLPWYGDKPLTPNVNGDKPLTPNVNGADAPKITYFPDRTVTATAAYPDGRHFTFRV